MSLLAANAKDELTQKPPNALNLLKIGSAFVVSSILLLCDFCPEAKAIRVLDDFYSIVFEPREVIVGHEQLLALIQQSHTMRQDAYFLKCRSVVAMR